MALTRPMLPIPGRREPAVPPLIALAAGCLVAAFLAELWGHLSTGLRPAENSYGAMVYMASVLNFQLVFACFILAAFAIARYLTGRLDRERRVTYENAALLYYYAAAQMLFGLVLVHGFPRLAG